MNSDPICIMHSFKLSAAVLATVFFSLTARGQYAIDPNSIPIATRTQWCSAQIASCPILCDQNNGTTASTTVVNECDPSTLVYSCVCGNGLSPNASEYSQTIPYFECEQYGNQCVTACSGDTSCQTACRVDNPCGAQDPTRVNATTTSVTSSSATSTGSAGVVYNGLGSATTTAASSSNSKSGSQAALDLGRSYSLVVLFTGLFAGFALVM